MFLLLAILEATFKNVAWNRFYKINQISFFTKGKIFWLAESLQAYQEGKGFKVLL